MLPQESARKYRMRHQPVREMPKQAFKRKLHTTLNEILTNIPISSYINVSRNLVINDIIYAAISNNP